jgi:hypothetical protein
VRNLKTQKVVKLNFLKNAKAKTRKRNSEKRKSNEKVKPKKAKKRKFTEGARVVDEFARQQSVFRLIEACP